MIVGNIHSHHQGRKVRLLPGGRTRASNLAVKDWKDPAHWMVEAIGTTGVVSNVESHGSNPWTRYSVRWADGGYAPGLVLGTDIEFI